jgi:serine phosphatase RsbU (regulator of sigma subunit)
VGGGFAGRVAAERKTLVIGEQAYDHVISDALRAARLESMVGVPLFLRGNVFGVLHIGSVESRSFGPDEIALIELTAERAAMAIDHARIYERERGIAETLQRALLPAKLPELDRMSAAVRYVPAAEGVDIGGDWYDVVQLPNGNVGVVMGDVTGHGIEAAALMALLRHGVRAYALEGLDPAQIAGRLDRLIYTPDLERLATLVYAEVAVDGALAFVNAGHLPPLVVASDGATRFLDVLGGLPIGCQSADGYRTEHGRLDDGETLVLYTDGLIERRGESIDDGLERLAETAASAPDNPHDLADHLLRQLLPGSGGEDDIALMTVRTEPVPAPPA